MHIKFLARGTGSARAAADYLLGARDATGRLREGVEVLRGNPDMVAAAADSLEFEHKYTSGVIAWAPDDTPTDAQIDEQAQQQHAAQVETLRRQVEALERQVAQLSGQVTHLARDYRTLAERGRELRDAHREVSYVVAGTLAGPEKHLWGYGNASHVPTLATPRPSSLIAVSWDPSDS